MSLTAARMRRGPPASASQPGTDMHCGQCGALNPDHGKFCTSCGRALASPEPADGPQRAEYAAAADPSVPADDARPADNAVPGDSTVPGDDTELYEAAIGPSNTDYYLHRFARFARGEGVVSWNWPACLITFYWLLYRKMWGYAAAYFILPTITYIVLVVALGMMAGTPGVVAAHLLQLALVFIAVPMFANALYFSVIKSRVEKIKRYGQGRQRQIRALTVMGGTSPAGIIVALAIMVGIVPMIGILAAIAIPQYQNYTIRAQVSEGLYLAAAPRAAVAETMLGSNVIPRNRAEAGLGPNPTDSEGRYVESVAVTDGRIDIVYGNEANAAIAGRMLSITPYLVEDAGAGRSIAWRCGFAPAPAGALELTAHRPTDVDRPYLPASCRY